MPLESNYLFNTALTYFSAYLQIFMKITMLIIFQLAVGEYVCSADNLCIH